MKGAEQILEAPLVGQIAFDLLAVDRVDRLIEHKDFRNLAEEGLTDLVEGDGSLAEGIGAHDLAIDPERLSVRDDAQGIDRPDVAGRVGDDPHVLGGMAELEESVGARSREIPAQYVGGARRRLAVNDEDELWVGDGVLDIEVLAGIKGNDGFLVKGVRNPPRHVQVDGLDRVIGITRLVRPHADLVAVNEVVGIVPQVVPIDVVGIKPELESGRRVREEISESDGKGMTDRRSRLIAGVSRLNGGQGYFPGTVN